MMPITKNKILKIILFTAFFFLIAGQNSKINAASCGKPTTGVNVEILGYPETGSHTVSIDLSQGYDGNKKYLLKIERGTLEIISPGFTINNNTTIEDGLGRLSNKDGVITWELTTKFAIEYQLAFNKPKVSLFSPFGIPCALGSYTIIDPDTDNLKCKNLVIYQKGREDSDSGICYGGTFGGCLDIDHDVWIKSEIINGKDGTPYDGQIIQDVDPMSYGFQGNSPDGILEKNWDKIDAGDYVINILSNEAWSNPEICHLNFSIQENCKHEENSCVEIEPKYNPTSLGPDVFSLCNQIDKESQPKQHWECIKCAGGVNGKAGIWTAIGCIKRDPQAIIEKLVTVGLGIGGGFALITFLTAGFIYSTSQGSPEKVKSAKEMMTASVVGLLFVIFSVTLLQFIGWSILKIPGFGG